MDEVDGYGKRPDFKSQLQAPGNENDIKIGHLRLTEMRQILHEKGLMLTKSLGQNFLHDGNILKKIVSLAKVSSGDKVLEVGPGMGALTGPLLDAGACVFALEKDRRLLKYLTTGKFHLHPRFQVSHADALEYLKLNKFDWAGWKLVSNLPYSVGSPIIVELALQEVPPESMTITLQHEVVEKIFSKPGQKNYGLLSILLAFNYLPKEYFKLPSGCFFPPPDVMSACGLLEVRKHKIYKDSHELLKAAKIAKLAFQQRRKTLTNSLKSIFPSDQLIEKLNSMGHPSNQRPEKLAPEEFIELARLISI